MTRRGEQTGGHSARQIQLINTLLEEEAPLPLKQATDQLFTLLAAYAGLEEPVHRDNLKLPTGTAIGPYWAAMCLKDFLRTQRFMSGIYRAVSDARKKNPGEQIHILYAGTGPFATLVLPIMARFSAKEIAVTLLDVHAANLVMLEKVLDALGFQDRVKAFIQADAATYQLTDSSKVHIAIAETMQHALEREPQAAISLNLAPQLAADTVWIPQNIRIKAALMNMQKDRDRQFGLLPEGETSYRILGRVLDLNAHTAREMAVRIAENHPALEECRLDIPAEQAKTFPWLALFTHIQIYGSYALHAWDSALCAPRLLAHFPDLPSLPQQVNFTYRMGVTPGFDFSLH
ncbi:MAG: hypothetical protein KF852_10060 [Saprospiraceae bacterium]|nr:hypothetical protein [Saprospiraceae bacterium]